MLREVVAICAPQCNACGNCLAACPHEALEMVDGLPRLVKDLYCSGDGLCVEACGGALYLQLREAAPFDEAAVQRHIERRARLRALAEG